MAIDEGGFTPEFFKGDNVRDLFEGETVVADLIAPVAVNDNNEIEKVVQVLLPGALCSFSIDTRRVVFYK